MQTCFIDKESPLVGRAVHANGNQTLFSAFLPLKNYSDSPYMMFTLCRYDSSSKTAGCGIRYSHLLTLNSLVVNIQSMLKVSRSFCSSKKHVFNWTRCLEMNLSFSLIGKVNSKQNNQMPATFCRWGYHLSHTRCRRQRSYRWRRWWTFS